MLTAALPIARLASRSRLLPEGTDPLDWLPEGGPATFCFSEPSNDLTIVSLGAVAEVRASGPGRFRHAAREARALLAGTDATGGGLGPLLVGGFAFEDDDPLDRCWVGFSALHLVLPALQIVRHGGQTWLTEIWADAPRARIAGPVGRPAPPAHVAGDWGARVRRAIDLIGAGRLEKIVLARVCDRPLVRTPCLASLARRLRATRPACTTYVVGRGNAAFVGSTPETLVRVTDGHAEVTALAGSAPRRDDPPRDAAAARALLACPKNAAEHAVTAREVRTALQGVCETFEVVEERGLRPLPEAFHLASVYRGRLRPGADVLGAAGALHPTPAVSGTPRGLARALIAAEEGERGWYAGAVGWMDGRGDGTFAVALRCGLLRPGAARLWAGAGIVAGSDPELELDETRAKMSAMVRALEGVARGD
jgi:isochorismate synthase